MSMNVMKKTIGTAVLRITDDQSLDGTINDVAITTNHVFILVKNSLYIGSYLKTSKSSLMVTIIFQ